MQHLCEEDIAASVKMERQLTNLELMTMEVRQKTMVMILV
jgi:hypothetical protein